MTAKWKPWVKKTIPCEQCGEGFWAKRAWARFCSIKCRDKWFYLERRQALIEHRKKRPLKMLSPRAAFLKSLGKSKT